MASAPKKPRTGDASAVDKQPAAEENPQVDGNPAIKEPRSEEKSSTDVPLAPPPPRLRMKACKCVQLHSARDGMDMIFADEDDKPPVRVLLVNRRWLHSFFDVVDFGAAEIVFEFGQLELTKSGRWTFYLAESVDGIAALLRLNREVTEMNVTWYSNPSGESFDEVHAWMKIASELQTLPNLAAIRLTAGSLKHSFAHFLVESLPDRIISVKTDSFGIATMLRKRQTPLESVEFYNDVGQHSYIADVLRLKSHRIAIAFRTRNESSHFHPLHDCGPLLRNEHLQELHVRTESDAECGTPQALRHVRSINDHFKLFCHESYAVRLEGPSVLKRMERIVEKAKKFAAPMGRAGFTSGSGELRIFFEDSKNWQHASREQVFAQLNCAQEGEIPWPLYSKSPPTGSLVHNGVRILIGLGSVQ